MNEGIDLAILHLGEWNAVYIDGILAHSGRETILRLGERIRGLLDGRPIVGRRQGFVDPDGPLARHLDEHGDYPPTLAEVDAMEGALR